LAVFRKAWLQPGGSVIVSRSAFFLRRAVHSVDGNVRSFHVLFKSIGKMMAIRTNDFRKLDLNLLVAFQVLVGEKSV